MTDEGMLPLRHFRFHWRSGEVEDADGYDIADAFRRAGYGGGTLRALDYWEEISDD